MKHLKKLFFEKGVLLIICLILLVTLAGIGLAVVSTVTTNNKASKYYGSQTEAQQKADAIANFALNLLSTKNADHTTDQPPCSMSKSCLVWTSIPSDIMDSKSNTTKKQWWRTYGQDYPQANALNAITDYFSRTGSGINDPVSCYAITETANDSTNGFRTFRIISYATDSTGSTAATSELNYLWKYRIPGPEDCVGTPTPAWDPVRKVCTTIVSNRWNGAWDNDCYSCFYNPYADPNRCSRCRGTQLPPCPYSNGCIPQGYYTCYEQSPPIASSNDGRIIGLITNGQCW